ncbi:MAG: hypothetical protein GX491_01875 [Chloroflexi bacterium]|nr:hypothetical protein [Chloroflexota bacterium]
MANHPNSEVSNHSRARQIAGEILSQLLNVPIVSGVLLTYIFFQLPGSLPNRIAGFGWALLFLCLIPLLSLFFYIPGRLRDKARIIRRQRIASFVFMIISYPAGFITLRLVNAPVIFEVIALSYTLITLGLILVNFLLRYKASGHAAGVAGPVGALLYFYGLIAAPLIALIPLTTWARVNAKGHDIWQTVVGALLSFSITGLTLMLYGFSPFQGILP